MAEVATKLPVKTEKKGRNPLLRHKRGGPSKAFAERSTACSTISACAPGASPFRRSIFGVEPFCRRELSWTGAPAVDITESDKAYEVTAELPGMDEKNIAVKVVNGNLTIEGKKQEEKEEKKKDYYLHERRFGSFERSFQVPEGVDADKIEASFKKGVLTVVLPKKPEAQKPARKIDVKAA